MKIVHGNSTSSSTELRTGVVSRFAPTLPDLTNAAAMMDSLFCQTKDPAEMWTNAWKIPTSAMEADAPTSQVRPRLLGYSAVVWKSHGSFVFSRFLLCLSC